jgi:hypothetical protein
MFGFFRKAERFVLPSFILATGIMFGSIAYLSYENKQNLKKEYGVCQSIEDKTEVRDTSLGEYSCEEIEKMYDLHVKE